MEELLATERFAARKVSWWGRLDSAGAETVAAQLMTLDAVGEEPIELTLSCPGGSLDAALSLVDVVDLLGVPVHAVVLGECAGPPVAVVAVCDRRLAAPHARFRLAEDRVEVHGSPDELAARALDHARSLDALARRVADAAKRSEKDVRADFSSGRYLSAEEARVYGLIDRVGAPTARTTRLVTTQPIGFRPRR
ncbi:MAG: clpP [Acidimicrobiaceae bacterium]|nr:clpP [Acidimicrobiaceae bacterium]